MAELALKVRVARKILEAVDICSFELVHADGGTLPAFSAGSHIDVRLPNGLIRQYSLCNDAGENHRYVLGVLNAPDSRGGSKAMHEMVQEGTILEISSPRNHFPLARQSARSLLLAGGIGVTPILCMAERLAITGACFEMHYCTRSKERTAFYDRIARAAFASRVDFHFDDGPATQRLDIKQVLAGCNAGTDLYVCGPKGFMNLVLDTARATGWDEAHLHYEFFGGETMHSDSDAGFRIKLASSGRIIDVSSNKSVVEALSAAGIEVPTSCNQGVCGTCLTRVLEGEPEHRDMYLTPEEQSANDQFMPCCSRSKSPLLVLDL